MFLACLAVLASGTEQSPAIREIHGGEDVDLAQDGPNGTWRWTDWVSRG